MNEKAARNWLVTSRSFVVGNWHLITGGFVIGAVFGLISPTAIHALIAIGTKALAAINKYSNETTTWPKQGTGTVIVIVCFGALFYAIRLGRFLKKLLLSWRAGLLSGIGLVWFLAAAIAFSFLNITGSLLSFSFLAVGLVFTLILIRRDLRIRESGGTPLEADPDTPISRSDEDILGRGTVVAGIVRAVVNDNVPVLSLTGSYGDGKTSVLNLLTGALELRNDVVVVRFSTWLPIDEKALVFTLLTSVLTKLETKLFIPKVKRQLVAVSQLLFALLPRMSALRELIEKPSQEEQFAEVQRNLSRLPVRVAVLLDDLDRMGKNELNTLLKLLRGVPEFPQFTYVCAFDRASLAQILSRDASEKSLEEARHFLEKFFPDEIPLPKIEESRLAVEFEKRFYAICDRNNLISEKGERQRFIDEFRPLWQMHLKRYFSNLRRLKLLTNRLKRSLPLVGQEVNLRDFILLETVRMMNPILYEEVFRNARYFMFARWRFTSWLEIVHPDEEEEQKIRNSYFDRLFRDLQRPPEGIVLALLGELFPTVNAYLTGVDVSVAVSQGSDEAQHQRKIYHPDFFPRYFIFNVPADLFGEEELSTFIRAMNEKSDVRGGVALVKAKYVELQELPMKRWDFLRRVNSSIAKFNSNATEALVVAMSDLSDKLEDAEAGGSFDELTGLRIVFGAANHLRGALGIQEVLERVIRDAVSDRFATQVLNESDSKRHRLIENGSAVNKDGLEQAFRNRMKLKYASGSKSSFFPPTGRADIVPLGRWALCGSEGREEVRQHLRWEFETQHSNIGKFLLSFFPAQKIDPIEDPRAQDPIGTITRIYFSAEELNELINRYGDSAYSSPDEARAVEEFKSEYNAYLSRANPTP